MLMHVSVRFLTSTGETQRSFGGNATEIQLNAVCSCRIESRTRPPSIRTGRQPRSSGSVRGTADRKAAGYDNPLYTAGDVLSDRDAADVMPVVVGDHVVVTPRQPESPLVAKLKAQAADKSQRLRQDRILVRLIACELRLTWVGGACAYFYHTNLLPPEPRAQDRRHGLAQCKYI